MELLDDMSDTAWYVVLVRCCALHRLPDRILRRSSQRCLHGLTGQRDEITLLGLSHARQVRNLDQLELSCCTPFGLA